MGSKIVFILRFSLTAFTIVFATIILSIPIIIIYLFSSSGAANYKLMKCWAFLVSSSMGLKYSLRGAEHIQPGQSYIITPNHQGNADILALVINLPLRFKWVIKRELLRIPVFGWALGATGAIALDRSNREASIQSLRQAKDKLSNGWSMLIYPEGTRTTDGNLLPFKKGPFMTAIQTGLPILPVTTNGAFRVLPKKKIVFYPGLITITVSKPIETRGLTEDDLAALMERTRNAVQSKLDIDYDPFRG